MNTSIFDYTHHTNSLCLLLEHTSRSNIEYKCIENNLYRPQKILEKITAEIDWSCSHIID